MSEYAMRNLRCSSWHKTPTGFVSWTSNTSGWTQRPFCSKPIGHAGNHEALIEPYSVNAMPGGLTDEDYKVMSWPKKPGIPRWLLRATLRGLESIRAHVYEKDQTEAERLDELIYPLIELIEIELYAR